MKECFFDGTTSTSRIMALSSFCFITQSATEKAQSTTEGISGYGPEKESLLCVPLVRHEACVNINQIPTRMKEPCNQICRSG